MKDTQEKNALFQANVIKITTLARGKKRTDFQEKVISSLYTERHRHNRHTKETDTFICDGNVYNTVVTMLYWCELKELRRRK